MAAAVVAAAVVHCCLNWSHQLIVLAGREGAAAEVLAVKDAFVVVAAVEVAAVELSSLFFIGVGGQLWL